MFLKKSKTNQTKLSYKRILEILGNLILLILYFNFMILFIVSFVKNHVLSLFLYAIYNSVIFFLIFIRKQPIVLSESFWYWIIAMGGSFIDLLMHPYPSNGALSYWLIPQCIGIIISFGGLLSLNKSFGLMIGNRGIQTKGMYRLIRHPLYAGYFLTVFSFLVQHLSIWNFTIFIVFGILQIVRIIKEEDFLRNDPLYKKYLKTTRWRLLPGIW